MEIVKTDCLASIEFAEVRISGDELSVYETALKFAMENLTDADEIERRFGAARDEIEGICQVLSRMLLTCKEAELTPA